MLRRSSSRQSNTVRPRRHARSHEPGRARRSPTAPGLPGILLAVLLPALLLLGRPVAAPAQDFELKPLLTTCLEVYNEFDDDPLPYLTGEQAERLVDGEVVRIRRKPEGEGGEGRPERVTGYIVIRQPRPKVWLAALDPDFQANDMLTEVRLWQDDEGNSRWYQHLSLPWPITDRHWVIDLGKRIDLTEATEGLIWEQAWRLSEDGPRIARETVASGRAGELTLEEIEDAIYLPANDGAWIMFSVSEDITFLAYRVTAVLGGSIPDSWITTFAMAQLEGLLRGVARHAEHAWTDYDPTSHPIHGGDGVVIHAPDHGD